MAEPAADLLKPRGLIAELTHRCPLGCPYCFNPLTFDARDDELDLATWVRVFTEAAALGVTEVRLSGGEPAARRDLVEIAASAREAGLVATLVTSGVGLSTRTIRDLWEVGLHHVEVSIQDSDAVSSDRIAGAKGGFQRKHALAAEVRRLGLPLAINVVVHRANIGRVGGMVDLALRLGAHRIALVPVRYEGWAATNRAALMPARDQLACAAAEVEELRQRHGGRIVIDAEWAAAARPGGGDSLTVTPSGNVLPCVASVADPGRAAWNVRDYTLQEIWAASSVFRDFHAADSRAAHSTDGERQGVGLNGHRRDVIGIGAEAVGLAAPETPEESTAPPDYIYRRM